MAITVFDVGLRVHVIAGHDGEDPDGQEKGEGRLPVQRHHPDGRLAVEPVDGSVGGCRPARRPASPAGPGRAAAGANFVFMSRLKTHLFSFRSLSSSMAKGHLPSL